MAGKPTLYICMLCDIMILLDTHVSAGMMGAEGFGSDTREKVNYMAAAISERIFGLTFYVIGIGKLFRPNELFIFFC